jgi:hypothetical protein
MYPMKISPELYTAVNNTAVKGEEGAGGCTCTQAWERGLCTAVAAWPQAFATCAKRNP